MTIKARIALGIAFLLSVIVLLGVLGIFYLHLIEQRSVQVYAQNFQRLVLVEQSIRELSVLSSALLNDDRATARATLIRLDTLYIKPASSLLAEASSENGEQQTFSAPEMYVAEIVERDFDRLQVLVEARLADTTSLGRAPSPVIADLLSELNEELHALFAFNQEEVRQASQDTAATARAATSQMAFLGGLCVLFAVTVLVWLPGYVTNPIARFSESIRGVTEGNFTTRLPIDRKDEFGELARSFNGMAEQLGRFSQENVNELIASRNRLSTLVNQLNEMILGMDDNRRIIFINEPMTQYLGLESESVLGEYMPDLALAKPRLQRLFEPIALGQSSAIDPFAVTLSDGQMAYYQERVVVLRDDGAIPQGYIIILTDVTAYEERTNRQTNFLATLSHEMKTPIAAVRMSVDLLNDTRLGTLDDDQRELTETIRKNNSRLLRMVNEVLQLSQNKAGETRLELDSVQISDLVLSAVEHVAPLARNGNVSIVPSLPDNSLAIEADAKRVEWVVVNVLTNAIRYSPRGAAVTVTLEYVAGGIRISVGDKGPGVPASERDRIFQKYARAKDDQTKGTGLGLAISREYVEGHGGRIYLDTQYEPGACFVIELPRRLPDALRDQYAITARS